MFSREFNLLSILPILFIGLLVFFTSSFYDKSLAQQNYQQRNDATNEEFDERAGDWLDDHGIKNDGINRQIVKILKYKLNLNDGIILGEFENIYGKESIEAGDPDRTDGDLFINKIEQSGGVWRGLTGEWTHDRPTIWYGEEIYLKPNGQNERINGYVYEEDGQRYYEKEQLTEARKNLKELQLPALEVTYQNPLSVNSFTALIGNFLAKLQAIIGWLAVIMIVIGGLVYITSTGRSAQIELGKKIITYALIGFAIAVAAPSILKEIVELARSSGSGGGDVIRNAKPIKAIIESALNFILVVFGIIATISFAISGILFILAGGDTGRGEKARKGLFYSIIGVVVAGVSLIIVKQVFALIGG